MNVRLQRRVSFEVRRDAAVPLTNGRVVYDALFSRIGYQTYGESVEYRPPSEVFDADSLASLANLPGVLLHPAENYGVSFGDGSYPVRGTTGSSIVEHTDGIHTAGQLIVWDAEWNDAISAGEAVELSLGYGITPGPAGRGPDGPYDVLHTEIIGDHAAGVPEGNAETARVVLDARSRLATRAELADIAAMRMDARPLHIDLGSSLKSWPRRQDTAKDTPMDLATLLKQKLDALAADATPIQIRDAWIDVYGESDDPAMQAVAAALAAPAVVAPAAPAAPIADAEEPDEDEEEKEPEADKRADAKAEAAARWRYADALELARRVHGSTFTGLGTDGRADRKDAATVAPMTLAGLQLSVVTKVDANDGAALSRMDAKTRGPALEFAFEQSRARVDEAAKTGPKLVQQINDARARSGEQTPTVSPEARAIQDSIRAQDDAATSHVFGAPAPAQAQ